VHLGAFCLSGERKQRHQAAGAPDPIDGRRGRSRRPCLFQDEPAFLTTSPAAVLATPCGNSHAGSLRCAEPVSPWVRPTSAGKKRASAPAGHRGVGVPRHEGKPKGRGRNLVWRKSQYERRPGGNAPGGDLRGRPRRGNASKGQRGARHLAGVRLTPSPDTESDTLGNSHARRASEQTTTIRGECEPALKLRLLWEGSLGKGQGRQPDSGNPAVRDERGGLGKRGHGSRTEAHGESHGNATGPYSARPRVLSRPLRHRTSVGPLACSNSARP
jgi:hypothetical protein